MSRLPAWPAPASMRGVDPPEMARNPIPSCVWGTNPVVHTQVNVTTHAMKARKERGAKIVVGSTFTITCATMKQADMKLVVGHRRRARLRA